MRLCLIKAIYSGESFWIQIFTSQPRKIRPVPVSPEDPVGVAETLIVTEKGIDVLPDHLSVMCNLEEPTGHTFADQRISVGKSLGAADEGAEEFPTGLGLVFPPDFSAARVDLEDPGTGSGRRHGMPTVVED